MEINKNVFERAKNYIMKETAKAKAGNRHLSKWLKVAVKEEGEGQGQGQQRQGRRRGPYHKSARTQCCQQIRKLLVEDGLSYDAVIKKLNIAERTFYRYLSYVFENDRKLFADRISEQEALNQFALCRDRLLKQRSDLLEGVGNNPAADWRARVDAHHLSGEIAATILKLYIQAPAMLAQRHQFPDTVSLPLAEQGKSGIQVILKNEKEEEEGELYHQHYHQQYQQQE